VLNVCVNKTARD